MSFWTGLPQSSSSSAKGCFDRGCHWRIEAEEAEEDAVSAAAVSVDDVAATAAVTVAESGCDCDLSEDRSLVAAVTGAIIAEEEAEETVVVVLVVKVVLFAPWVAAGAADEEEVVSGEVVMLRELRA